MQKIIGGGGDGGANGDWGRGKRRKDVCGSLSRVMDFVFFFSVRLGY